MNKFFLRQFFILFSNELKNLFFRKRAIFAIFIYVSILFIFFWGISKSREFSNNIIDHMNVESSEKLLMKESLDSFKISSEVKNDIPILKNPWPVIVYFFISLTTLPFLIPLISCDMIASDIYNGTQRFLLFRVSRDVYFWAKNSAHFTLYIILQSLLFIFLCFLCLFFLKNQFSFFFIKSGIILSLKLIPVIFAFLALCQFISSQVNSPLKSLIVNNIVLLIMFIILSFKPILSIFYGPLWKGLMGGHEVSFWNSFFGFGFWGGFFLLLSYYLFSIKKL